MLISRAFRDNMSDKVAHLSARIVAQFLAPHPAPVFVFGLQKSGTTAIAAHLAAGSRQRACLDFPGAWEPHRSRLLSGETSIEAFIQRNASSFAHPIIKEPCLTPLALKLLDHFPDARAVFVIRDPIQNIRSILNRVGMTASNPIPPETNLTWRTLLSGKDSPIEALATHWSDAANLYLQNRDRFTLLKYETFCADKAGAIRKTLDAVYLPVSHNSLPVNRQFQQTHLARRSTSQVFTQSDLNRITDICGPYASQLGYVCDA